MPIVIIEIISIITNEISKEKTLGIIEIPDKYKTISVPIVIIDIKPK